MSSQNWSIVPCWEWITIGDTKEMTLAYDLTQRADDEETTLIIEKIPMEYLEVVKGGMLDFYYPENPLLGKLICSHENYIIHERSDMRIPCAQWDCNLKGIYFQTFLARGRLPFPIVIVNRQRVLLSRESRKRRTYYPFEVIHLVFRLALSMEAEESYHMLMIMKDYWNDLPKERFDIYTWYHVVNQLVKNISKSEEYTEIFQRENPNLVYVERKGIDRKRDSIIENAQRWAREGGDKRRKVNPVFRLMQVPSLVEEYECIGQQSYRELTETETKRMHILQAVVRRAFWDFLPVEQLPDIVLVKDGERNTGALAFAEKCYGKKQRNQLRQPYKYRILKAVMEEQDMLGTSFEEALLKYVDILCHCFGTDKNATVNSMLTECGGIFLRCREEIQVAKEKWME